MAGSHRGKWGGMVRSPQEARAGVCRKGWGHTKFLTWFFEVPILNEHVQSSAEDPSSLEV